MYTRSDAIRWGIRRTRPYAQASAVLSLCLVLSGCAQVKPRADFALARRLIAQATGVEAAYDPDRPLLTEEQLDATFDDGLSLEEALRVALLNNRRLHAEFASIGVAPQTRDFDPDTEGPGTVIGDHNVFREHCSVHRSIHETEPTRIGNQNLFMDSAHAGHDVVMGDRNVLANGSALGGHVVVADDVIIGGNAAAHQFVRLGRGALMSGLAGTALDVMPWFVVTQLNVAGSFNIIGLRRNGFSSEQIDTVRWVYRTFVRQGISIASATERLKERAGDPLIDEYIQFVEAAERPICTGRGRQARNDRDDSSDSE